MKSFLVLLAAIFYTSTSDDSFLKSCPTVNVIKPFQADKGVWYQFAISGDLFRNPCEKSVTLDWAVSADGKNITITTYRICSKGMICRRKQTIWKAKLGDPDEKTGQVDGKLNLTVNHSGFGRSTTVDLLVLNTDYVHSAVLYTCTVTMNRTMAIWILTRKQKPTDMEMADILTTVDATLETNRLDQYEFRLTNPKCESVVKNNSEAAGKQRIEDPVKPPSPSTNTSTALQTYPGTKQKNSNNTTSNKNNKSDLNPSSALLQGSHNKTNIPVQKLNETIPTPESSKHQRSSNDSFQDSEVRLNRTFNRANDKVSSSGGKVGQKKHVLYSVLENLRKQTSNNNFTNIRLNRTVNKDIDTLSSGNGKVDKIDHELNSVLNNLLKHKIKNDNFTIMELNRTSDRADDILSGNNDKTNQEKPDNMLYSALENVRTQNPDNNNVNHYNRLNELPNIEKKLSRRQRRKLLKKKLSTFEQEQNMPHSTPGNSDEPDPTRDTYSANGLSGDHYGGSHLSGSSTGANTEREAPVGEGFYPSLARQAFFKYIPRAFNFDFLRI